MSDEENVPDAVDEALAAYAAAHRDDPGEDPVPYLERVPADQQPLLEQLLDAYLAHAPRASFDRERYEGSWMQSGVGQLGAEPAAAAAKGWRALLPELRARAELTRESLVAELAKALGVAGREQKVGGYYHEMEQELLDPAGVSDRVFDALGALFSESAEAIRAAGVGPGGAASPGTAPTFARTALPDARYETDELLAASATAADAEDWDEVDELFRGDSPDLGEARPPR